jgi:membrane-associated phospholipid phosphatase
VALRPLTLYTMIALAYCAGLRVGEIVGLKLKDLDLTTGTIEIQDTKFFKSRRLPLSSGALDARTSYLTARQRAGASMDPAASLFWHEKGGYRNTQIVSFAMKHAIGRLTPSDIPPHGDLSDTWFKYKGTFTDGGSFPSGHTASAFAVATVVSGRYRSHRWIPWVAYGTATLLSLTRLPDQAHFPSDIFIGAVLGYSIGHFVVLQR